MRANWSIVSPPIDRFLYPLLIADTSSVLYEFRVLTRISWLDFGSVAIDKLDSNLNKRFLLAGNNNGEFDPGSG